MAMLVVATADTHKTSNSLILFCHLVHVTNVAKSLALYPFIVYDIVHHGNVSVH